MEIQLSHLSSIVASDAAGPVDQVPSPYLVFLGSASDLPFAKTAIGLRDWARDRCLGEWSLDGASIGLPRLDPAQAARAGARALVIGVANIGGALNESWIPVLEQTLAAGLDVVSGMHGRLGDNPQVAVAARRHGRRLIDLRVPPPSLPIANGLRRTGKRLLTVGTDCALGKKYTALALTRALRERGIAADFRATGQTGILIAGQGVPLDAVIGDFMAGAAEQLSPDAAPDHWDIIEGQGSLFHPSYAGVSLALLHGSQPDCLVLCHAVARTTILGLAAFATPHPADAINLNIQHARLTNPAARCGGVALNTAGLDANVAAAAMARLSDELGLPVADPMRGGPAFSSLVDNCLEVGR
jgi:uncharacterized NAD-dependent epimerase/dehydratase family protein